MHPLKLELLALAAAAALAASPVAFAAGDAHSHAEAMPAKLALDHGKRWPTDAPLRAGMDRIRAVVVPGIDAAHAGKMTPEQYQTLAGKVETEVAGIVANCKLEPQADAMLHLVIADLGAGTDALAGRTAGAKPEQGLVHIATAVNNYGRYFDHPGFKKINLGH